MPKTNQGQLWEQYLRLKVRKLFPKITITQSSTGRVQILDNRDSKRRKTKVIPVNWEKDNTEEIINQIYSYLKLPQPKKDNLFPKKFTERKHKFLAESLSSLIDEAHHSPKKLGLLKAYQGLIKYAIDAIENQESLGKELIQ